MILFETNQCLSRFLGLARSELDKRNKPALHQWAVRCSILPVNWQPSFTVNSLFVCQLDAHCTAPWWEEVHNKMQVDLGLTVSQIPSRNPQNELCGRRRWAFQPFFHHLIWSHESCVNSCQRLCAPHCIDCQNAKLRNVCRFSTCILWCHSVDTQIIRNLVFCIMVLVWWTSP